MVTCYEGCWGPSPIDGCSPFCTCTMTQNNPVCFCCQTNDHEAVTGPSSSNPNTPSNRFVGVFDVEAPYGCKLIQVTDGTSHTIMAGEQLPDRTPHSLLFYTNGSFAITSAPLNIDLSLCPLNGTPGVDIHSTNPSDTCDGFKSAHPGVCNFSMVDASVHGFALTIDYELYNVLATKAGGETFTTTSHIPVTVPE